MWDLEAHKEVLFTDAHTREPTPSDLFGSPKRDPHLTLFLVTHRDHAEVGQYANGQLAVEHRLAVRVVYYPEAELAGEFAICGDPPPGSFITYGVSVGPVEGPEAESCLHDWIVLCARAAGHTP